MNLEFLLLMFTVKWCTGVRLSPMENNDKLQDITNLYVAEWQWESWPVKQEPTEQEGKSPGQRKNVALWRDGSKSAWYLFGGQPINGDPKKVYSDVWKFTIKTRVWKRFFPSQTEIKDAFTNKKGVTVTLGVNQQSNASNFEPVTQDVVLCGGLEKKNATSSKKLNIWSSFRRKKFEEEKKEDELLYLALYSPKESKSNTVWKIDVKKKLWTAYVCCCNDTEIKISNSSIGVINEKISKTDKNTTATKNERSVFDQKINNAEDKAETEQQHLNNTKNKKKKINQIRKSNEKSYLKQIKIEKKSGAKNETKTTIPGEGAVNKNNDHQNDTKIAVEKEKQEQVLKPKTTTEKPEKKPDKLVNVKNAKNCPNVTEDGISITWCDGRNEAYVTADIHSSEITIQVFNLTTSQWSQFEVNVDGDEWQGCTNKNSIRYAGNEEEVYIICSQSEKQSNASNKSHQDPSEIPSEMSFNKKLVFRINYKNQTLHSLGKILLNPYFNSPEGETTWQNDTQSILEVLKNSENETILILAYLDMVDLWFLNKNREDKENFELTEKLWRGSALKWFDKYNAPLYSLQFVSESGNSETILLPNPRNIDANEYWPRERGRFIIRVFKNENLKNQTFENRTRDQNLTYELLQSDYKPSGGEHQLKQMYSLKVLVFFGISLAIFTVFGFVVFLKRCVSCPPRIRIRNECHKSPLIIRYSVIPDDLLYPVA